MYKHNFHFRCLYLFLRIDTFSYQHHIKYLCGYKWNWTYPVYFSQARLNINNKYFNKQYFFMISYEVSKIISSHKYFVTKIRPLNYTVHAMSQRYETEVRWNIFVGYGNMIIINEINLTGGQVIVYIGHIQNTIHSLVNETSLTNALIHYMTTTIYWSHLSNIRNNSICIQFIKRHIQTIQILSNRTALLYFKNKIADKYCMKYMVFEIVCPHCFTQIKFFIKNFTTFIETDCIFGGLSLYHYLDLAHNISSKNYFLNLQYCNHHTHSLLNHEGKIGLVLPFGKTFLVAYVLPPFYIDISFELSPSFCEGLITPCKLLESAPHEMMQTKSYTANYWRTTGGYSIIGIHVLKNRCLTLIQLWDTYNRLTCLIRIYNEHLHFDMKYLINRHTIYATQYLNSTLLIQFPDKHIKLLNRDVFYRNNVQSLQLLLEYSCALDYSIIHINVSLLKLRDPCSYSTLSDKAQSNTIDTFTSCGVILLTKVGDSHLALLYKLTQAQLTDYINITTANHYLFHCRFLMGGKCLAGVGSHIEISLHMLKTAAIETVSLSLEGGDHLDISINPFSSFIIKFVNNNNNCSLTVRYTLINTEYNKKVRIIISQPYLLSQNIIFCNLIFCNCNNLGLNRYLEI